MNDDDENDDDVDDDDDDGDDGGDGDGDGGGDDGGFGSDGDDSGLVWIDFSMGQEPKIKYPSEV